MSLPTRSASPSLVGPIDTWTCESARPLEVEGTVYKFIALQLYLATLIDDLAVAKCAISKVVAVEYDPILGKINLGDHLDVADPISLTCRASMIFSSVK